MAVNRAGTTPGRIVLAGILVWGQIPAAAAGQSATPATSTPASTPAASTPAAAQAPQETNAAAPAAAPQAPMSSTPKRVTPSGRVSFFVNSSDMRVPNAPGLTQAEFVSGFSYRLTDRPDDGLEFGLDMRHSRFTASGRQSRLSIYDGFVGARLAQGAIRVRGGQMWLNDLGGLGSVAGGMFEYGPQNQTTVVGRLRGGVFAGLEPRLYRFGYEPNVRKYGGYVALDGSGARRHVAGLIRVSNGPLTERSVLSFTNFLPVGRTVFVYQAAEYDLQKPAGEASRGLNYFFTNARVSPTSRLDLQMTVSRGRSIDIRGLSEDLIAGRPVSQTSIEGLLYQSVGGRATVEVFRGARVYAGFTRDKDNREDAATRRWLFGGFLSNLAGSGLDVTVSDSLNDRPSGSYHSRYFSVGRQAGRRTYLTVDYNSSLSVVRFLRSDGFVIESRPKSDRLGSSAVVSLNRTLSLLVSGEYTWDDDLRSLRVLSGITYRIR